MDEMQGEGVGFEALRSLDVSRHSAHWARSLAFIGIVEARDVPGAALSVALRELDAGPIAFVAANQAGVRILNLQTCDAFCPADFVAPFGVLDLQDISAFIGDFQNPFPIPPLDNRAELLAPPEDIADLADIVVFVESFNAGCP